MIHVIASIRVAEGKTAEFLEIFKANVPAVKAEEGCIDYLPVMDVDSGIPIQSKDAQAITIIERWESLAALKAHLVAPHMGTYREKVKDLVEGVTLKVLTGA